MTTESHCGIELPWDAYRWNRAHRGAFKKGVAAFVAGEPIDACPYGDYRNVNRRLTWSRAFICAWGDGWRWARRQERLTARETAK